ncbi:MAG: hypothetical protein KKA84_07395 [Bacteroidetes bacterium]|nr:hypothetical protein [Bacteroidota bacterium]
MEKKDLVTKLLLDVKSFECGPDSNLRINNLLLLFQEAAYLSAENLGFGYSSLKSKNMTWVLSGLKIVLKKYPKWTDKITLSTWPSGYNRLHGFRDYAVESMDGDRLINATSEWLAIDVESRRPININDFEIELPDYGVRALDEKLSRLNPKRFGEGQKIYEVKVPYSAIDENGHVNNAEYLKWSLDGLRSSKIEINEISSLQISFISEVFENQNCEIFYLREDSGSGYLWGINSDTKEFVFAMHLVNN